MVLGYLPEVVRQALLARLQFRVSLAAELAWATSFTAVTFAFWHIVTAKFAVPGWSQERLFVFLAFVELYWGFSRGLFGGARRLQEHILRGTLDIWLCRPVDPRWVVLAQDIDPIALLRSAVLVLFWLGLAAAQGAHLTVGPLLLGAVVCLATAGLFALLFFTVSYAAFYIGRAEALDELASSAWDAARYPMDMFGSAARAVFTWVLPALFAATAPALLATGGTLPAGTWAGLACLLPVWWLIQERLWRAGLRRYESANG